MYVWTAPGAEIPGFRMATGVSDDHARARQAAEAALRTVTPRTSGGTGPAGTAYVERVYTALTAPALSLGYVRTGTGWRAQVGRAGRVTWTPFTALSDQYAPAAAPRETVPPEAVLPENRDR
jgi:hypothetical protein